MKIVLSNETRQLFQNLDNAILAGMTAPNSLLPAAYHGKNAARTLASVTKQYRKLNPVKVESEHERDKREKLSRITNYQNQIDSGNESLTYDVDEHKLYASQLTFCGAMELAGVMERE